MSPNLGTMALEDGGRVDFARLRHERRERLLAEMERRRIDVLILGRAANARYAAGARPSVYLAEARPFGPGCIVVGATGEVHLGALNEEGIPAEIPFEHLLPFSFNPATILERLVAIEGVAAAPVVGVDGMSVRFEQLLRGALPRSQLVPADDAMQAVRRVKTPEEVTCIRTALAVAEGAMAAMASQIRSGVRERQLLGAFAERMSSLGVTTPAMEGTFCVTPRQVADGDGPLLRQLSDERLIKDGDLVACSSGALYAGYEGSLARTYACGQPGPKQRDAYRRWRAAFERVLAQVVPGRTGADLRAAYEASGEPLVVEIAHGMGLGYEPPVIGVLGSDADGRCVLEAGMVLGVQAYAWVEGAGGYLGKEVVLVSDDGPVLLTRLGHGPLADAAASSPFSDRRGRPIPRSAGGKGDGGST